MFFFAVIIAHFADNVAGLSLSDSNYILNVSSGDNYFFHLFGVYHFSTDFGAFLFFICSLYVRSIFPLSSLYLPSCFFLFCGLNFATNCIPFYKNELPFFVLN